MRCGKRGPNTGVVPRAGIAEDMPTGAERFGVSKGPNRGATGWENAFGGANGPPGMVGQGPPNSVRAARLK